MKNLRDEQQIKLIDKVDQMKTLTHQLEEFCRRGNWARALEVEQ